MAKRFKFKCQKCGKALACELVLTGEPIKPPTNCPYGNVAEWIEKGFRRV